MLAKEVGRLSVLNRVEDKVDNLLQKIEHVLEEEGVSIPSSKLLRVMMQAQEQGQYTIFDTEHTSEDLHTAASIWAVASDFVTTRSPLEDIWKYQPFFQYPGQQPVVYSVPKVVEENKVKIEHK